MYVFVSLEMMQWEDVLVFIVQGGCVLVQYLDFYCVVCDDDGVYCVYDCCVVLCYCLLIGIIISDGSVMVQFLCGGWLGVVEEQFVGWL